MKRLVLPCLVLVACTPPPRGLRAADEGPGPVVTFDVFHLPLPEVPLPNDFATRFDAMSPTKRRINAAIEVAPTKWERSIRRTLDGISGWGTLAPITVSFTAPLDVADVKARHQAPGDLADDALYVFDVTRGSPGYCQPVLLDLGQGHFPLVADDRTYFPEEPHDALEQLMFEQQEEDLNGNGVMDPGEDTDMDGVLDHPNTLDGKTGGPFDVIGFYEHETNTLIARPLEPMREATTYAVVLTTRLKGKDGAPIRSPFPAVNHLSQTQALAAVPECLTTQNLSVDDVAFAWSFTTQSITADYVAVRDGMKGLGPLAWLKDRYPAEIATVEEARRSQGRGTNTRIVPGSQFLQLGEQLLGFVGGDSVSEQGKEQFRGWLRSIDFLAAPTMMSPQFFPRKDSEGNDLPFYLQTMDLDPARGVATVREETVPLFLSVPKNRNGPAPVVIFVHGHTGSKLDSIIFQGPMARFGMATVGIDAVSHGVGVAEDDLKLFTGIVESFGVTPLANAILRGRAYDQNGDGVPDPGADFFSAYVPHSRDTVKQTAFDVMRLVQVLRGFDGVKTWKVDINRNGLEDDLAGDFDGDGVVDLGGPGVPIYMAGASLGGIMSSLLGGLEPEFDAMLPVLPGGYLSEIGSRTALGQVKNPLVLRMFAPLFLVRDGPTNPTLSVMYPSAVRNVEVKLAALPNLTPGQLAVARNLTNGEWRCARVQKNGHLRLSVPSDKGDALRIELYEQELPTKEKVGCDPTGVEPSFVVEALDREVKFEGQTLAAGTKLTAFQDGYGLRRGSPEMRRLLALGQIALESADPANVAPFYDGTRTLTYGDGQTVATRGLLVPMAGDPGVPISTAAALMRAAGFLDVRQSDPRYGKSMQQVLIDVGFVEGVERTRRYLDPMGRPVLMDVDVFQSVRPGGDDGFGAPRLNPPLRPFGPSARLGGTVGAILPFMDPRGAHSFPIPDPATNFDLGSLLMNVFGVYLSSGGKTVSLEPCMERSNCSFFPPTPAP
ncbi:MAG: hypothetical protein MUC96_19795 [Myxococcaceae bacterium]|nr:hypothetical protein [Myxococcaceae bacterium]